jgi:hypothetical protein
MAFPSASDGGEHAENPRAPCARVVEEVKQDVRLGRRGIEEGEFRDERLPPQILMSGFRLLRDRGQRIVTSPGGDRHSLPAAHTRANTLDLPVSESAEDLKVGSAIHGCDTFAFKSSNI